MPEIIFITGANRGIGLGVTQHLIDAGHTVIASCRQPDEAVALREMQKASGEQLILLRLDVIDEDSALEAVAGIGDRVDRIDVLFNNAGVSPGWDGAVLEELDLTQFLPTLETNIVGSVIVARACLPLLRRAKSPRVVNVSSGAASLSKAPSRMHMAYAVSKAGLNMVTRMMAKQLGPEGITVVSLQPGWIKTDMGGPEADLEVDDATSDIAAMLGRITAKDNGDFLDRFGKRSDYAW
ncbi:MAG: SDR family NAD(P)-dependent oxidoreductase [Opitutae bacterium]|nr:SDR family NAD(P)-dependent oxidoreductase [Opitutae bacterium]